MFRVLFKTSVTHKYNNDHEKNTLQYFTVFTLCYKVTYSDIKSLISLDDIAGFATLGGGFLTI